MFREVYQEAKRAFKGDYATINRIRNSFQSLFPERGSQRFSLPGMETPTKELHPVNPGDALHTNYNPYSLKMLVLKNLVGGISR